MSDAAAVASQQYYTQTWQYAGQQYTGQLGEAASWQAHLMQARQQWTPGQPLAATPDNNDNLPMWGEEADLPPGTAADAGAPGTEAAKQVIEVW